MIPKIIRNISFRLQFWVLAAVASLSLHASAFAADFELNVEPESNPVSLGSELILTVRFSYDTCCIKGPVFSELEVEGATVSVPSIPQQYEEIRGERRYGVYQFTYTLIPHQLGQLQIPSLTMSGQQIPPDRVFSATPDVTQEMSASSQAFTVTVIE